MQPKVVTLPPFTLVGFKLTATLDEFEAGLGKDAYRSLVEQQGSIPSRKNDAVILMQIYPMDHQFNAQKDRFIQIIGYEVLATGEIPGTMVSHAVEESKYVAFTHRGREAEIHRSYDYLYGQWLREHGYQPKAYDFERWDERYRPEQEDNEIDMFVALQDKDDA